MGDRWGGGRATGWLLSILEGSHLLFSLVFINNFQLALPLLALNEVPTYLSSQTYLMKSPTGNISYTTSPSPPYTLPLRMARELVSQFLKMITKASSQSPSTSNPQPLPPHRSAQLIRACSSPKQGSTPTPTSLPPSKATGFSTCPMSPPTLSSPSSKTPTTQGAFRSPLRSHHFFLR